MELKAGYKQTEIGIIPENWTTQSLADVCIKIQDGTHFSPKLGGHDFLYLTSKNIRFGYLDLSNIDRIDAKQHESIYKRCDVKIGDLLLTKDGANTGNATLNPLSEEFSLLSSVAFLRFDKSKNIAEFYLQQILSDFGQSQIKEAMSGNAITRLTLEKINKLRFPSAPVEEQRAIATALSDVDALLAKLDALIAKKRDLKQAAMQQLLTAQTRLPGFSGEWESKTIFEIAENKKELFDDGDWIEAEFLSDNGVRLIQTGNIGEGQFLNKQAKKYISDASFELLKCKALQIGDLLICRLAEPAGRACIFPNIEEDRVITAVDVTIFRPSPAIANRQFLVQIFNTPAWFSEINERCGGSTRTRIARGELGRISIQLPSIEEQTAIATILSDMDAEITTLEARRDKTRTLKQGMMQELLTGRTRLI